MEDRQALGTSTDGARSLYNINWSERDLMSTDFIIYEAKAFYNAYINLEQLNRECEDKMLLYIPMLVNGAFSIEITLKAILFKKGIRYGKEHNLLILFEMLPKSIQDEIWSHLTEKAPEYTDQKRRIDELTLISNAFVDYRYVFEGETVSAFDARFLSAFANAAIWTMFSFGYNSFLIPGTSEKTEREIGDMIENNRAESIRVIQAHIEKKRK